MARNQVAMFIRDAALTGALSGIAKVAAPVTGQLVRAYVKSDNAMSGGTAIFDVNKNGSTVFAAPGDRLTIADGQQTDEDAALAVACTKNTDVFTIDFDGFTGSAVSVGDDLTLVLEFEETGATATDAALRDRSTHTGTQTSATVSDFNSAVDARIAAAAGNSVFNEAVDDRVAALLVEGTNITLTYNDGSNTLAIDSDGGGAADFTDLGDVPASYTGQGEKLVAVKVTEDGLEFIDAPSGTYTDEQAQDAVGGILADDGDIDFTYDDATPKITGAVKDDSVTYAKMQNVSAESKLLGRGAGGGAGDPQEITLGTGLSMSGTTLNATAAGGSDLGVRVTHSTTQSLTSGNTATLAFDTETRDDGGWHDNVTDNSRLTVPTGKDGWYIIHAQVRFQTDSAGQRIALIRKNGSGFIASTYTGAIANFPTMMHVEALAYLAAGDYVEVQAHQNSGSTRNVEVGTDNDTWFGIVPAGLR